MRLPIAACALLLVACGGREVRPPEGITVVRREAPPPPPEAVMAAQERLAALELYHGPIDGDLTPALRVALARFQRERELSVSGELDPSTAEALGIGSLVTAPVREAPPDGMRAARLLDEIEIDEAPQPPPGSLAAELEAAQAILIRGEMLAARELAAAGERSAMAEQEAADRAAAVLADARREAFDLLLEARRAGGWAPLPPRLIEALEGALQERSLLLRGADGRIGPDDEAAIRWLQRSFGQPPSGRPSVELLEALSIDPAPMFVPP